MKKNRPMLHNPGCHGPLKWCTVCETQTKMDKATDPSIPLIQFSPLRQCTVSTLAMRLTLKFFSLMVKSCSVHPSPIIAILRQWTLLRHLIRQIVICIVHFLWLSVIQHLKDSIQTILLSHRRQKKKGFFTRKSNNDPSHNRRKHKMGFSCLWWVHTAVCIFIWLCGLFPFI